MRRAIKPVSSWKTAFYSSQNGKKRKIERKTNKTKTNEFGWKTLSEVTTI
jgi:hypothetical protein